MCRRTTFSVVFFCKRTKVNKKGKAPIYARISEANIGNEMKRLGTKMAVCISD